MLSSSRTSLLPQAVAALKTIFRFVSISSWTLAGTRSGSESVSSARRSGLAVDPEPMVGSGIGRRKGDVSSIKGLADMYELTVLAVPGREGSDRRDAFGPVVLPFEGPMLVFIVTGCCPGADEAGHRRIPCTPASEA